MENELPLDFNGPFHKSEIKSNHKQDFLNKPGVYIWGFMYAYKSTSNGSLELNDPIDFKEYPIKYEARKMLFIPYYVGISTTTLFERLNKHQNVRCDPSTKYTRLSIEYIKKFFKNEKPGELDFPINIKGKSKKERNNRLIRLIKKYKKSGETSVTYFNDLCILNEIYNPKDKKSFNGYDGHWPITNQFINNNPMSDPLNELVSEKNNFWFYFAEYENPYKLSVDDSKDEILKKKYKKAQEELYEKLEAITFWKLKGKTISEVREFHAIAKSHCEFSFNGINIDYNVQINTQDIAYPSIFKENISTQFPGY